MERLKEIKDELLQLVGQLSAWQQFGLVSVIVGSLVGLLWMYMSTSAGPYSTVYSDVSEKTASKIVEKLEAKNIDYKMKGPTTIAVPQSKVYQARLEMAGEGLPDATGQGFEMFNEAEFGMTNFTQKVNYQRALENELVRTIQHLDPVKSARIHLVMPEEALFEENERSPSASVVLTLEPGKMPSDAQIDSIRHFVASAVEKLNPSQVTVVDNTGKLQASGSGKGGTGAAGPGTGGGGQSMEVANELEKNLEERISALLGPMVGVQHIRSSVNVELDTSQVNETIQDYDPQQIAIRSEQKTTEQSSTTQGGEGGAPGAASNLPGGGEGGQEGQSSESTRRNEVVNYEIDKTTRQIKERGFQISRLSAGVLIDKSAVTKEKTVEPKSKEGDKGDQQGQNQNQDQNENAENAEPKTKEVFTVDKARLQNLVKRAIGYQEGRGDKIEVVYEEFRELEGTAPKEQPWYTDPQIIFAFLKYGALLALVILVGVLIVWPLSNILVEVTKEEEESVVGRTVGEVEGDYETLGPEALAELEGVAAAESPHQRLRQEVIEMSKDDLDRTGQVIRQWLRIDQETS